MFNIRLVFLFMALAASVGIFFSSPQLAMADGCANIDKSIDTYGVTQELPKLPRYCTTGQLTRKVLNIAFALIGGVSVLFIIIGGYQYITSNGNAEAASKGRKTVVYALAGLAVVILAVTAVNLVVNLLIYNKAF